MNMQMKNRLACAGTDVQYCSIAILDIALASYLGGRKMASAKDLGVLGRGFFQSDNMFLGDDQYVRRTLRV